LKDKQRLLREGFPEALALRVHRALSWLGRAVNEEEDIDLKFIVLWIGFNAAYANELNMELNSERGSFRSFFDMLVMLDKEQKIYNAVWKRYSQEIRLLLENKYVFAPFWQYQNGVSEYDNWEERLASSRRVIASALTQRDTSLILSVLFDRLYVLRNQVMHGGATWNSSVNRSQIRDGSAVMDTLLPIFIELMMDHPQREWGKPFYPVVSQ
jgi:hypothetical protein